MDGKESAGDDDDDCRDGGGWWRGDEHAPSISVIFRHVTEGLTFWDGGYFPLNGDMELFGFANLPPLLLYICT